MLFRRFSILFGDGTVKVCDGTHVFCDGTVEVCDGTVEVCNGTVEVRADLLFFRESCSEDYRAACNLPNTTGINPGIIHRLRFRRNATI
jgi:hypothetical protein